MFPEQFTITSIDRIIYVSSEEYKEKRLCFDPNLKSQELILHLSGEGTVLFNGKRLETSGGMIRFLPEGNSSEYIVLNQSPPECIDIFFHTDISLGNEAFLIDVSKQKQVELLFKKAFSIWTGKENCYYFKVMSILYEIFSEICIKQYAPKEKYQLIEPAVNYIQRNFLFKMISVSSLAKNCGISESYLKKLFILNFGISPKQYITKLKMDHATELLSSGMFSVGSVANATGFENIYYFSSAFKKHKGLSPSAYMKKCKSSK